MSRSDLTPLLASVTFSEVSVPYQLDLKVYGGLNYLKGNKLPYFSITGEVHRHGHPNHVNTCGAIHDVILEKLPQFADLAALHLSDMHGAPSHAESNGWYWLSGFADFANGERHRPTDSGERTPDQCRALFASHCRISDSEVTDLLVRVSDRAKAVMGGSYAAHARKAWALECALMAERWQAEASACIAKHGLVIYGNTWGGEPLPERSGDTPEPVIVNRADERNKAALALLAGMGLAIESTFVPFSESRNKDRKNGKLPALCMNWKIRIVRADNRGRVLLETDYGEGMGSLPSFNKCRPFRGGGYSLHDWAILEWEAEHGKKQTPFGPSSKTPFVEPNYADVLESLVNELNVMDFATFEDWADDLGFDKDSRKWEAVYNGCLAMAVKLRAGLGGEPAFTNFVEAFRGS